jgi:hypothetical protein
VTPDEDRGWMHVNVTNGEGTFYTEGNMTYQRVVTNGSASYGTTDGVSAVPDRPQFGADERIEDALASANWTHDGSVTRDGERLTRFVATDVDLPEGADVDGGTAETSGELLIAADGSIRHVDVHASVDSAEGAVQYSLSVSVSDVGSTAIERPDWVDQADDEG